MSNCTFATSYFCAPRLPQLGLDLPNTGLDDHAQLVHVVVHCIYNLNCTYYVFVIIRL